MQRPDAASETGSSRAAAIPADRAEAVVSWAIDAIYAGASLDELAAKAGVPLAFLAEIAGRHGDAEKLACVSAGCAMFRRARLDILKSRAVEALGAIARGEHLESGLDADRYRAVEMQRRTCASLLNLDERRRSGPSFNDDLRGPRCTDDRRRDESRNGQETNATPAELRFTNGGCDSGGGRAETRDVATPTPKSPTTSTESPAAADRIDPGNEVRSDNRVEDAAKKVTSAENVRSRERSAQPRAEEHDRRTGVAEPERSAPHSGRTFLAPLGSRLLIDGGGGLDDDDDLIASALSKRAFQPSRKRERRAGLAAASTHPP